MASLGENNSFVDVGEGRVKCGIMFLPMLGSTSCRFKLRGNKEETFSCIFTGKSQDLLLSQVLKHAVPLTYWEEGDCPEATIELHSVGNKDIMFCAWDISIYWLGQDIILKLPKWGQLPPPWGPPQKFQWNLSCFPMVKLFSSFKTLFLSQEPLFSDCSHDPGSCLDSLALGC